MVLLLNDTPVENLPLNTNDFYNKNPSYIETAKQFLMKDKRIISPEGLLYVMQCEFAVWSPTNSKLLEFHILYKIVLKINILFYLEYSQASEMRTPNWSIQNVNF